MLSVLNIHSICLQSLNVIIFQKEMSEQYFHIFTDGSSIKNSPTSSAGWAAYFPTLSKLISYHIIGTNNIAELTAVKSALHFCKYHLDEIPNNKPIKIYTDSKYVINMLSNGFKSKANIDLINKCKYYIQYLASKNHIVKFSHVSAHTKKKDYYSKCNDLVDKTARSQAEKQK